MLKKMLKIMKNPYKIFVYLAYKGYYKNMDDAKYLKKMFRGVTGKKLNLDNPQTFNEKLQWLKLYNRRPEYTVMVDKYKVREYVERKLGCKYLIPLIGVWDSPNDIDFDKMPDKFVLKCNHNSGLGMCICQDKSQLDIERVREGLQKGLSQDYYSTSREWPYKNVERKIIGEKFMVDESGTELKDYKVMCFNGEPKLIQIHRGRFGKHTQDFYDCDWKKQSFSQGIDTPSSPAEIPKPVFLDEMLELTKILAKDIPHARIDWYYAENQLYFGEITFFDGAGFECFHPYEWDIKLGNWIELPDKYNEK